MKYLKRFNESSNFNEELLKEVEQTCQDILIELEDDGFVCKTDFSLVEASGLNRVMIYIHKYYKYASDERFKFSDIEDVVLRVSNYLSDFGIERIYNLHSNVPVVDTHSEKPGYPFRSGITLHFELENYFDSVFFKK